MIPSLKSYLAAVLIFISFSTEAKYLVLEGDVADRYVGHNTNNTGYEHVAVVINQDTGLIEKIVSDPKQILSYKDQPQVDFLSLRNGQEFDVIYPGLIDLHNHTKQNNLGVWSEAHGQFANRFEWRNWGDYVKSLSNNLNPWIGYGKVINCATFRWSEIQAMVVGTTYLQGPSNCVGDFAIHQVEDADSYPYSQKDSVQAPTDLVIPSDMVFVWNVLKPLIDSGQSYEQALAETINKYCSADKLLGRKFQAQDTLSEEGLAVLKDRDKLEEACIKEGPIDELPDKFIRYIYWVHKTIAGKKNYAASIKQGQGAAIIAHLAEGRRDDEYNQKEYEIVQLLGMNQKGVNFVHGVGISDAGLKDMAAKQMGLIWSPFSNLLLYSQTLDLKKAIDFGVMLSLGSDWLPTGTKGPLEELKIAREYVLNQKLQQTMAQMPGASSFDEALYNMVTENPAKMINHWQGPQKDPWSNGESLGGIGTIAPKAMASLLVTSKLDANSPYTNLVAHVWEEDVNLVIVDGKIQYGNKGYVQQFTDQFEIIGSNPEFAMGQLVEDRNAPILKEDNPSKDLKLNFLDELAQYIITKANRGIIDGSVTCHFKDSKVFVLQNTFSEEEELQQYFNTSGLNLDRFQDIQRLLGVSVTTQSRNRNDKERGDKDFAVEHFTPLYTCNDPYHSKRVKDFIHNTWPNDRKTRPKEFSNTPARLAEDYR